MNPDLEVAGLLIGPPPLGQCQIINKYMPCDYAIATVGSVKITPKDFYEIKKKIKPSEIVVGWGHSHPGYGAFISSQDYKVEDDFQAFYSDSVALVIDPFHPFNVNYGFFRIINGQVAQLPYRFLIGRLNI
jgi:proteasome lid subunit RPN8/RPN11